MAAPFALAQYANFDVEIDDTSRTLKPRGEVDALTAPILFDAAKAMMAAEVGDVTVDLARVTFASSALVNGLISMRTELGRQGAGLWLVNEPSCVLRVFRASGFSSRPPS